MKFFVNYLVDGFNYQKEIEADRCVTQGNFTVFKKGKKEFFCIQTDFIITINTQSFEKKEEKKPLTRKEQNSKIIDLYKLRK